MVMFLSRNFKQKCHPHPPPIYVQVPTNPRVLLRSFEELSRDADAYVCIWPECKPDCWLFAGALPGDLNTQPDLRRTSLHLFDLNVNLKVKVTESSLTLCDPMDYTVHGILQAWILEWVAFPLSRGSSQPRDQTQVSHIAGRFFTSWATIFLSHTLNPDRYPMYIYHINWQFIL